MKKFLIALLAVILTLGCVFAFSSCSDGQKDDKEEKSKNIGTVPELDLDVAQKALENAGYEVNYEKNPRIGYEESIYAYDSNNDEYFSIAYFETEELAKIYFEELKLSYEMETEYLKIKIKQNEYIIENYNNELSESELDEYEEELDELKEKLDYMENEISCGVSGNIGWYGSNVAAKATKGEEDVVTESGIGWQIQSFA